MDGDEPIQCVSIGVGLKVVDGDNVDVQGFVTLGEHEGEMSHIILLPLDRLQMIIFSLMSVAREAERVNQELAGFEGAERLAKMMDICARYNAGIN